MTTANDVIAIWSEIASLYDPTEADPVATALLRNPAEEEGTIAHAIEHMKLVGQTEGNFLGSMGYEFCLERSLWRKGIEAVLQARALQQVLVWASRFPEHRQQLQRVVVRHTFDAGFHLASPQLRPYKGINFIVIPFVYQELLLLPAAALAELLATSDAVVSWDFLRAAPSSLSDSQAPRAFRKLVARILTGEVFDPNTDDENAVSVLSRSGGWFAGVDNDYQPGSIESVLGYSGQDFAIAHELGHLFPFNSTGEGGHLHTEIEADIVGYRLYVLSWGWRDEVLEDCPIGESARTLLGPIWFFFTAGLLFAVRQGLKQRIAQELDRDADFLGAAKDDEHVGFLASRWMRMRAQLNCYAEVVVRFGGTFSTEDAQRIANLVSALDEFAGQVGRWLAELPARDLLLAVQLVRPVTRSTRAGR